MAPVIALVVAVAVVDMELIVVWVAASDMVMPVMPGILAIESIVSCPIYLKGMWLKKTWISKVATPSSLDMPVKRKQQQEERNLGSVTSCGSLCHESWWHSSHKGINVCLRLLSEPIQLLFL